MDCLLIGYNEMDFSVVKEMSENDFYLKKTIDLQYIKHNGIEYTAPQLFSHFCSANSNIKDSFIPVELGDSFSNTIAYLGSFLLNRGYSIDYVNTFKDYKEELAYKLSNQNVKCVAIPTTFYLSYHPIKEIVSFVRHYNKETKIVVGGPYIAKFVFINQKNTEFLQETFHKIGADYYVYNFEGETALSQLVGAIKNRTPVEMIDNIYYNHEGNFLFTKNSTEDNNLEKDTIDWKLFKNTKTRVFNIRTSKSCPFCCSFCTYHQVAGKYTTISVEALEKELNTLKERGDNVVGLGFVDDTFNVPPDRFKEILRMMIKNKYNFKWASYFRCQYADRETVELMKQSGCEYVLLGIESGNQQILDNMNKKVRLEDYKRGIALLNEYNIANVASIILGFPGETIQTFQDTVDFIEECKPTFVRTNIWFCDPFSPIYHEREKFGIEGAGYNWVHSTMDSKTASELEYDFIMKVKNSIWNKHLGVDAYIVFSLIAQGFSVPWIKEFITTFNDCVKDKLINGNQKEITTDMYNNFKTIFSKS